ncbi:MAG: ribosome biogenesis GTPase Der [Anaerolineae bacterium]|nr:ribosome biogenesis GTPase Der [Anaerolineae bacterium]MDW8099577.1 ribosome biogenesis GTPase Der [Anaerolineae bacterium]
MKPVVALVGRPNVGKSTLFNRIIGERRAIVEDIPGTTRDRLYAQAEWAGVPFILVDTGGLEIEVGRRSDRDSVAPLSVASADYVPAIRQQVRIAIEEADVVIFLVDAQEGLTPADQDVADLLRATHKPIILAVNKADNPSQEIAAVEFWALGLGEPHPISALHGRGIGDLLDAAVGRFPRQVEDAEGDAIRIAIVGRPNVGKSSLLNALLGQERAIVSEIPGTTRDAIDTELIWEGQRIILVDTAGIRRRGRIERGLEYYSVLRALRAIERADVVLLLVDAAEGVTAQDTHVAGHIVAEYKSVVVVVNKWDLVKKDAHTMDQYMHSVREALNFMDYAPVLFISAKTRQRVDQVIPTALRVYSERRQRVSTAELNRILQEAITAHPPPTKGKPLRFYYATQVGIEPPTFVFFVNDRELIHFSYERYLENVIRTHRLFEGTPIRLQFHDHSRLKRRQQRSISSVSERDADG